MPPYFYPITQILPYMKIKEMNLFLTQGQIFCVNWYSGRAMGRKSGTSKSKGIFPRSLFTEWEEKERLIRPEETFSVLCPGTCIKGAQKSSVQFIDHCQSQ